MSGFRIFSTVQATVAQLFNASRYALPVLSQPLISPRLPNAPSLTLRHAHTDAHLLNRIQLATNPFLPRSYSTQSNQTPSANPALSEKKFSQFAWLNSVKGFSELSTADQARAHEAIKQTPQTFLALLQHSNSLEIKARSGHIEIGTFPSSKEGILNSLDNFGIMIFPDNKNIAGLWGSGHCYSGTETQPNGTRSPITSEQPIPKKS